MVKRKRERSVEELLDSKDRDDERAGRVQLARGRGRDPELWCGDLDWLLNESASALGFHGTFGGFLSIMEHGGPHGMTMGPIEAPNDDVLGTTARHIVGLDESKVARFRRLDLPWRTLPKEVRAIHQHRYCTTAIMAANAEVPGIDGQLGWQKGVVIYAHSGRQLARILVACERAGNPNTDSSRKQQVTEDRRVLNEALRVAEALVRGSHRAWYREIQRRAA